MGKLAKVINGLWNKASEDEKRYEKAFEAKGEELVTLSMELAEQQVGLKDLHKMALLGDVSQATYEKEAEKAKALQQRIQELQTEMELIKEFKTDDVQAVLAEMEANSKELSAEVQAEVLALKEELVTAKHEYLNKMVEARKRYSDIVQPQTRVEKLKDKLGMKNRLYYQTDSHEALSLYSVSGGSYISLEVKGDEVHDALYFGRLDSQLVRFVKKEDAGK